MNKYGSDYTTITNIEVIGEITYVTKIIFGIEFIELYVNDAFIGYN